MGKASNRPACYHPIWKNAPWCAVCAVCAVVWGVTTMTKPDLFGPWATNLEPAERLARLRSLRALVQLLAGPDHPLCKSLARAEVDPTNAAAHEAWETLMTMPSLRRRRILASLATLTRSTTQQGVSRG